MWVDLALPGANFAQAAEACSASSALLQLTLFSE